MRSIILLGDAAVAFVVDVTEVVDLSVSLRQALLDIDTKVATRTKTSTKEGPF